jgi:hypothetical protein
LEVSIKEEQVYLGERGAGLGWVVSASGSVVGPDFHYNFFNYYIMARTSRSLGN